MSAMLLSMPLRFVARCAFLALALLLLLAGGAILLHGSLANALAFTRGDPLVIEPQVHRLENINYGKQHVLTWTVTNLTGRSLRIVGMNSSCTCTTVDELPDLIPTSSPTRIRATITAPEDDIVVRGSIKLYTADRRVPEILLGFQLRPKSGTAAEFP